MELPDEDEVPVSVRPGDTNADLFGFIATANSGNNTIGLIQVNPDRSTAVPLGVPAGSAPVEVFVADFNLDADASSDIDIAILADGVVKVLRNDLFNGQLAFTPIPDQPAGTSPTLLRSADLNVDGRDDVVTIAESTGAMARSGERVADAVNILLAAPEPCAGDVSGNGDTNISDFNILASDFGCTPH